MERRFPISTMVFLRFILLISAMLSMSCALGQTPGMDADQLEHDIAQALQKAGIPGCSLAIVRDGETVFYRAYGVKRSDSPAPIDPNTIFEAASLTKPIVAYCAMKLVEEKLMDLDTPLYTYLEYPDASHDDRYKSITPRLVLSHMSGFPNWRSDRNGDTLNIRFDPGSRFGYSGEGFVYLQKVMEGITGTDLNTIAMRYVFQPLDMERSSLVFMDDGNFAIGHDTISNPKKKFKPDSPNAAYSLHTTAGDYAKFINELVDPHAIGRASADQMLSTQSYMSSSDDSLAWGLGVGLNLVDDQRYIWHWGDNGVFRAFFIVSRDSGLGFVYFTNSQNGLGIVSRMIELVYSTEGIMEGWNDYDQLD